MKKIWKDKEMLRMKAARMKREANQIFPFGRVNQSLIFNE
jgi:hypothetical protein